MQQSSQINFPENIKKCSIDQIKLLLEKLLKENDFTAEEIIIFNQYHSKKNGTKKTTFDEDLTSSIEQQQTSNNLDKKKNRKSKKKEKIGNLSLGTDKKLEITNKQIDDLREKIERENLNYKLTIEKMRSQIKEADLEIEESQKENLEFRKEIAEGGINKRTNKVIAEKLRKFLELKLKIKDGLIDKLVLHNSSLKGSVRKSRHQLQQRQEMGEVLSKIDYDQLKIENDQMQLKIDKLNDDLSSLKSTTSQVQQLLTRGMTTLNNLTNETENLTKQIESDKKYLEFLKEEIEKVMKEKDKQNLKNSKLKSKHELVKVPPVLEYVKLKTSVSNLQKEEKDWKRKLEIAQGNLKVMKQRFNKSRSQMLNEMNMGI